MRKAIEEALKETCEIRKWTLWALNARTNHVHSVVTANCKPKRVVAAFKANATRKMREARVWSSERSPWVGGGGRENISGLRKR
jgi:REP element-mobilizing transposase RayT